MTLRWILASTVSCIVVLVSAVARADSWPVLASAPRVEADASKDAALIVGIDEYAFVPHVEGAAANARDWFTFLVEGEKLPIAKAHLLRDRDGTREQILGMAKKAASEVQPGGRLWIVFIGHGAPAADAKDGVLVGVDAQQTASGLYARSVTQREIVESVSRGAQASTVFVIDACFSGRTASGAPIAPGLQPLIRVKETDASKTAGGDTAILTAGAQDQFAGPLPGLGRPAFSYLVLGALRGWGDKAGKRQVTAEDAVDYAKLVMAVVPLGRTQTPAIAATNAKVVLSRGGTEHGPELSRIVTTEPKPSAPAPSAPPAGGLARLRVRATCAQSPTILAGKEDLVVEEIGDASDTALKPASSLVPSLRYDEASHERVMTPPDFVDFDLPAGPHRLRVKARHCKPVEERVSLEPAKTLVFEPHLDPYVVPLVAVSFARPSFASTEDHLVVRGADGKVVCADLPCATQVPALEQSYAVSWVKSGGSAVTSMLPDPGEGAAAKGVAAEVTRTSSMGIVPPVVMGVGGVAALLGLVTYANNQGDDANGVDRSGRRAAAIGVMIGGGAVIAAGAVLAVLGVGAKERLVVTYTPAKRSGRLELGPGGAAGTF